MGNIKIYKLIDLKPFLRTWFPIQYSETDGQLCVYDTSQGQHASHIARWATSVLEFRGLVRGSAPAAGATCFLSRLLSNSKSNIKSDNNK